MKNLIGTEFGLQKGNLTIDLLRPVYNAIQIFVRKKNINSN